MPLVRIVLLLLTVPVAIAGISVAAAFGWGWLAAGLLLVGLIAHTEYKDEQAQNERRRWSEQADRERLQRDVEARHALLERLGEAEAQRRRGHH